MSQRISRVTVTGFGSFGLRAALPPFDAVKSSLLSTFTSEGSIFSFSSSVSRESSSACFSASFLDSLPSAMLSSPSSVMFSTTSLFSVSESVSESASEDESSCWPATMFPCPSGSLASFPSMERPATADTQIKIASTVSMYFLYRLPLRFAVSSFFSFSFILSFASFRCLHWFYTKACRSFWLPAGWLNLVFSLFSVSFISSTFSQRTCTVSVRSV